MVAGIIALSVVLFGVSGSVIVATGDASAGDVLTGTTFSNASGGLSGTLAGYGPLLETSETKERLRALGYIH